jgi:hypothetical protein
MSKVPTLPEADAGEVVVGLLPVERALDDLADGVDAVEGRGVAVHVAF